MPKAHFQPEASVSARGKARSIVRFPFEGDDERDAILRAARSVAALDFNPAGSAGRATAYLSGPATLTTAGHAVRDDAGAPMEPTLFEQVVARFFVRDASGEAVGAVLARPVAGSLRFEDEVDVARFDVTFVLGEPPPPLEFDDPALDEPVAVVTHGHAATLRLCSAFGCVRAVEGRSVIYDCDIHHGASGAPVFNARWRVIATHARGVSAGPPPLKEGVAPAGALNP